MSQDGVAQRGTGVDLRTIQELKGHRNIGMTVRYLHLAQSHTLAAVERLSRTIPASPTGTLTSTGPYKQNQSDSAYVQ